MGVTISFFYKTFLHLLDIQDAKYKGSEKIKFLIKSLASSGPPQIGKYSNFSEFF